MKTTIRETEPVSNYKEKNWAKDIPQDSLCDCSPVQKHNDIIICNFFVTELN